MWTRILLKPWWMRALTSAGVYAVLVAAGWGARWLAGDPYQGVLSTLAWQFASTVIFGLLLAAFTRTSHKSYTNDLAGLDAQRRSAAVDASFRGPVPADPSVRDAAIRVTERRLLKARLWRVRWLVLFCLVVALDVLALALSRTSPEADDVMWDVVILCFTVTAWYVSGTVKRRLQVLRQTGSVDAMAVGEAG